jgi:hypothetical protein
VTLWFHGRGALSINAGVTVTCNGKVVAARKLSDVVTGPGTFTLGATAEWLLPEPPAFTAAALPTPGIAGRSVRVTDNVRGLWIDTGSQWSPSSGKIVNVRDLATGGEGTAASPYTGWEASLLSTLTSDIGVLFEPGKVFRQNTTLFVNGLSNVAFYSLGQGATILVPTFPHPVYPGGFLETSNVNRLIVTGLRFVGGLQTANLANQNAVTIWLKSTTGAFIYNNRFEDIESYGVFIHLNNANVVVRHNEFIRTHAGVQTGDGGPGSTNGPLFILDNYFLGNVTGTNIEGSDDQIGIFGAINMAAVISGNYIDKQGPTSMNIANGIIVASSGPNSENNGDIIITNNIVKNVRVTASGAPYIRSAILVSRNTTPTTERVVVANNIVLNCNSGIYVLADPPPIKNVIVEGNIVRNIVAVPGQIAPPVGIIAHNAQGIIIADNLVDGSELDGIVVVVASFASIVNNIVTAAARFGLKFDQVSSSTVSGNIISASGDYNVLANALQSVQFMGNIVRDGSSYGIRLQGVSPSAIFIGNVIENNALGPLSDISTTPNWRFVENSQVGTLGLSSTNVGARNLRGSVTFTGGTSVSVTFPKDEPDANYFVAISASSNQTFWVTSKTVSGFTINASGSSTATVDWILVR